MKKILLAALLCILAFTSTAQADDFKDALQVYKEYLAGTIKKDLGYVMERLDKTSPSYKSEIKNIAESMINADISFRILSAELVGVTGDYIVLRIVQTNTPKSDNPDLKGAEIDSLQILHKDSNGNWKFRNSQLLSVKQIN